LLLLRVTSLRLLNLILPSLLAVSLRLLLCRRALLLLRLKCLLSLSLTLRLLLLPLQLPLVLWPGRLTDGLALRLNAGACK
jgi:hypothetical protein